MEDGLEEGKPAGWEEASARVLERHIRRPDEADGLLLLVKKTGR